MKNKAVYLGDNLQILEQRIENEFADLVYLDPPFKSNRNYALDARQRQGEKGRAEPAFEDTWKWSPAVSDEFERITSREEGIARALMSFRQLLGENDMTAYLTMMAPRLLQLKRALKNGGSIYLHCDPATSHYLKILMDAVFGPKDFKNEIIWHYRRWTNTQSQFQKMHDTILFYRKGKGGVFNPIEVEPTPSQAEAVDRGWNVNKVKDKKGSVLQLLIYDKEKARLAMERGILDPKKYGRVVHRGPKKSAASDTWTDIQFIHSQARERVGYPTQKPVALLERIIQTSTDPGAMVLDPFCGSGTTLVAAESLGRKWTGIDASEAAVDLTWKRLCDAFGKKKDWKLVR